MCVSGYTEITETVFIPTLEQASPTLRLWPTTELRPIWKRTAQVSGESACIASFAVGACTRMQLHLHEQQILCAKLHLHERWAHANGHTHVHMCTCCSHGTILSLLSLFSLPSPPPPRSRLPSWKS